jgi:hypothetical protein
MTYTFKLARRLAVSRTFGMLPALLVFAACSGGDATAPDSSPAHPLTSGPQTDPRFRQTAPVMVSINPGTVTVETNQLIRFLAIGKNSAGDTVGTSVDWTATGGTILPDGRFSAATTGSFMVLARSRDRQLERIDTAVVDVVRRQPELASIAIAPGSTSLTPGLSQTFLVTGYLMSGRPVPVGAIWSATGGTIDAGGTYVAGDTAGTYHVVATNTKLTISDTAVVTISAPPSLPPPPPAPPALPPVLESVTLSPDSATLAPSVTRQFAAFGRLQGGDSVAVNVVYTATGGTITSGGLFTAGSTAGTFRVIARVDSLADTSTVTVKVPLGSGPASGLPFGPFWGYDYANVKPNMTNFSLSLDAVDAVYIIDRINAARRTGVRLLLAMTGGKHAHYMTNGVFDMAKWIAKQNTFNTPAIKAAIAAGVADGTIVGASVMDEPNNTSIDNSWGPKGTMTKVMVDQMASHVKAMFPTLPTGVVHKHNTFEPTKSYKVIDFVNDQYAHVQGDVVAFRDAGVAMARRDGHAVMFSINILDGGTTVPDCPVPETGGKGTYGTRCRVTAAQLESWGKLLGEAGCGLTMWRYDSAFMSIAANQRAFKNIAAHLAAKPAQACRRS